ncbi:MAG: hypothetical protein HKM04_06035 [Legionellales bacterium]|nr:hypothetical protein [Legionellales bacterium]
MKNTLEFSTDINYMEITPPVMSYTGLQAQSHNWDDLVNAIGPKIRPLSKINRQLFAKQLPLAKLSRVLSDVHKRIPSLQIKSLPEYCLAQALNNKKLSLPVEFFNLFPNQREVLDKAHSFEFKANLNEALKPNQGTADQFLTTMIALDNNQAYDLIELQKFTAQMEHDLTEIYKYAHIKTPDTALSQEGLNALMQFYAASREITGYIFMNASDFMTQITSIKAEANNKPVVCMVFLEPSKRHATGFYFQQKNEQSTVYTFDTMGLTLPAAPCGLRGYKHDNLPGIESIFQELTEQEITIAITPVNTVLSLQRDKYSCLIATMLFFEGIYKGEYENLDTPGITSCFGEPALSCSEASEKTTHTLTLTASGKNIEKFNVNLYVITSLPFLVGCQNLMAFMCMMDSIKNADTLFPHLAGYMADWQRAVFEVRWNNPSTRNIFWQACYAELLAWFNLCHQTNKVAAWPDFEALAKNGYPARQEKSEFENKISEIELKAKNSFKENVNLSFFIQAEEESVKENVINMSTDTLTEDSASAQYGLKRCYEYI